MELESQKKFWRSGKIGHYKNLRYPFFKKSGKKARLFGKKKRERAFLEIKELIEKGIISTDEVAARVGRSPRQTRRYIKAMASVGMVTLDKNTGRLMHETITDKSVLKTKFSQTPVISKWIDDCIARQVRSSTIRAYVRYVRYMFNLIPSNPKDVVSSKNSAIEFWTKFMVEYRKQNPTRGNQRFRTSFRNFLSSHEIIFAPRMGKVYGLSSAHDNYAGWAGVYFSSEIISEIGRLMLQDGDFRTYVWWRIGLRTGARIQAISKMVWERIYLDEIDDNAESFRLEQHETKDPRGHWHLGENGEWKTKYVPLEIRDLLLRWKSQTEYSRFVWFEDGKSDEQNRKNALKAAALTKTRFKSYYEKISDKLDPRTREYVIKRPTHILRHTLAQQMKNAGLTDEEIAEMFGWRSPNIVGTWYTKISEKKRKELGMRCSRIIF